MIVYTLSPIHSLTPPPLPIVSPTNTVHQSIYTNHSAPTKGFGGGLQRYVSIRAMVGVNSLSIRAIKSILTKPGMCNMEKIAILCGGEVE